MNRSNQSNKQQNQKQYPPKRSVSMQNQLKKFERQTFNSLDDLKQASKLINTFLEKIKQDPSCLKDRYKKLVLQLQYLVKTKYIHTISVLSKYFTEIQIRRCALPFLNQQAEILNELIQDTQFKKQPPYTAPSRQQKFESQEQQKQDTTQQLKYSLNKSQSSFEDVEGNLQQTQKPIKLLKLSIVTKHQDIVVQKSKLSQVQTLSTFYERPIQQDKQDQKQEINQQHEDKKDIQKDIVKQQIIEEKQNQDENKEIIEQIQEKKEQSQKKKRQLSRKSKLSQKEQSSNKPDSKQEQQKQEPSHIISYDSGQSKNQDKNDQDDFDDGDFDDDGEQQEDININVESQHFDNSQLNTVKESQELNINLEFDEKQNQKFQNEIDTLNIDL